MMGLRLRSPLARFRRKPAVPQYVLDRGDTSKLTVVQMFELLMDESAKRSQARAAEAEYKGEGLA